MQPCANHTVLEIVREIPLDNKKTLVNIEKNERLDMEQEILEFCKQPRSLDEIKEYTKLGTTKDAVRRHFINPLIRDGRLKYTHDYKCHLHQKYINSQVEVTPEMLINIQEKDNTLTPKRMEMILELCKEPKGIREIEKHIGSKTASKYVAELIKQGKLKFTIPSSPYSNKQKYINSEIEYQTYEECDIIEFCREPRTKSEIAEHFNMTTGIRFRMIKKLLEKGLIDYTEESKQLGFYDGNRRLIKIG